MSFEIKTTLTENVNTLDQKEQLLEYGKWLETAPLTSGGSWGPLSWDCDFHIDTSDIRKSYAYIRLSAFGFSIIDGRLDIDNPRIKLDLTVAGVGVYGDLGIDFNSRKIYLKGYLNFIFYKTDFDITILSF